MLTIEAALAKAQEASLDLVEISPMAKPPVCKLMDYGKFKYETKKKASEAKKKQVVVHLKEVKLRPKTEEHDYDTKVKNVRRFLEEGNKARITIMFRGREITHKEIGQKILQEVVEDVKGVGVVEQLPRLEGRQMFMILSPDPKYLAKMREQQRQAEQLEKKEARDAAKAARSADGAKPEETGAAPAAAEKPAAAPEAPAAKA